MTRLPSVLLPGDLPLAELCAARLDGELRALDEGFVLCDLPTGAAERGAALLAVLPRGTVADRSSAAWVHGATTEPPALHSASIDREHRLRPRPCARVRFHEVRLPTADVVSIGGCPVTTPVRTLIDLTRVPGRVRRLPAPVARADDRHRPGGRPRRARRGGERRGRTPHRRAPVDGRAGRAAAVRASQPALTR
ncbi:type IV toxin-antitoxin system AbiEi family antitoxin [Rathayibacter sp. Leaf296]|uniref:type IV toxin-antitoxin system AbiEi family antitoxin n=1 Tax=Rathayibacter sp. Leaf296 TaxID=1736327 RepID=UPI000702431F|nr:type IV toxin-antitoxin system AbiEi family antitoxin [Rathayibacter sp. Leaf296]KQQ11136.1 hypothetical protein ASF46_09315 [Rathayibacter sp. Leaf296]